MAEYVRLRAPKEHGQALQLPPVSEGASMVEANRSLLAGYPDALKSIRILARSEIKSLALQHSQGYLEDGQPKDDLLKTSASDAIVMSGHQPTLFHPGVWFKNFVLDSVARTADAVAINLVVDNDHGVSEIVFPTSTPQSKTPNFESVIVGTPVANVPYEMMPAVDRERLREVGEQLVVSTKVFGENALVESFWSEFLDAAKFLPLPASIAAARHRVERKNGLRTLELPVSVLSTSESFAKFVEVVVTDASRFRQIYNTELQGFRRVNRIRSQSRPVPELQDDEGFIEVPFWIWTRDLPARRRLFVKVVDESVEFTDRVGWSKRLSIENFATEFRELNRLGSETFVRPRALATTMFSRLFASDLFIHGIGGAKYDQLGDEIATHFFGVEPPRFMTATATMKLPFLIDGDSESGIAMLKRELRNLRYHPELKFANDERVERKRRLVGNRPATGSCKAWHDEIDAINQSLFAELASERKRLESQLVELQDALPSARLANSREFSFVLFPESLVAELKELASAEC